MKDIAVLFDQEDHYEEFEGRLNAMWPTWGGRDPPGDSEASKKVTPPYEGASKRAFYVQDFTRFDVDRLTPQIVE
eukprot:3039432-Alexandrium_andersonii.AAC.1